MQKAWTTRITSAKFQVTSRPDFISLS